MSVNTDSPAEAAEEEKIAWTLMGRRVCANCDGTGAVLYYSPGHEECCGPELVNCQSCGGRGWEKV